MDNFEQTPVDETIMPQEAYDMSMREITKVLKNEGLGYAEEAEDFFLEALEAWQKRVGYNKTIMRQEALNIALLSGAPATKNEQDLTQQWATALEAFFAYYSTLENQPLKQERATNDDGFKNWYLKTWESARELSIRLHNTTPEDRTEILRELIERAQFRPDIEISDKTTIEELIEAQPLALLRAVRNQEKLTTVDI